MEIAALGLKVQGVDNIDKAEASLNKFTKSAVDAEKSAGGVADGSKKAGTSLADVAKNSNSAGGALGKVASSAKLAAVQLVAVAAAAMSIGQITKTLAGFEQSMASVAAITRASASEMDAMRTVAKQLGAETEFSASQAADGFKYLGLAGWSAEQSIAAIPGVVDLATAASLGLADAANITSNIMSAYSIGAERATDVTDILAGVSSRANTDVAQLGDAMKYVGPVAASLGISAGDTAAALGVLADASIQGGMGGTALRTVISSLIKPTGDAEKALKSMGLSLSDVNPATNDLSDIIGKLAEKSLSAEQAVTIFGLEGSSAISALVAQSPKLAALTKETGNMADEAGRMADVMRDNLQGDLLGFGSALEGVVIAMGEAGLTKVLRTATQGTTALLREMTKLITYMGDNLPAIAGTFGLIFAPQILTAAIGSVKLITAGVVALGTALKTAALTNPFTAAVAVAATFGAYLYSIKDEVSAVGAAFDTMGYIVSVVFNEIKDIAVLVFDGIKAALTTVVGIFTDGADNIEITWLDTFSAIFKAIDAWYGSVLGIVAGIGGAFRAMGENIKIVFNNVRESVSNSLLDLSGLLDKVGLGFDVGFFDAGGPREFIDVTEAAKKAFEEMSGSVNTHAKFMGLVVDRESKKAGKAVNAVTKETKKNTDVVVENTAAVTENTKKTGDAADALQTLLDRLFPVDKAAKTLVASIKTLSDAYKKGLIDNDKYRHGLKLLGEEYDNVVIAETKHLKALDERVKAAQGALKTLGEQVAVYGKTESAVARLALAETKSSIVTAEAAKAKAIAANASSLRVKQLDIEIKKLYELAEAQGQGLALINEKEGLDAVAEIAKEAERVSGDIERSLTDALLRGFESGKGFAKNLVDTLKNMFNTLVLRPVIQPIAASLAGAVTGALGLGGTAQAGQAASGLGGLSGIGSLFTDFSGKSGQIISEFGQKLFETNGMLADFGKTLMINGESIGNFAGMAGAAFNYGMGALDLFKGNYGAGIGAIGGQIIGGPIGGAIGKTLGSMLDGAFKGETRGGGYYQLQGGTAVKLGGASGGDGGPQTADAVGQLFSSAQGTIDGLFKELGINAGVAFYEGMFEDSKKGRGGVFSGGILDVGGQQVSFGTNVKGAGYGSTSGNLEEMFENLQKDLAFSTLEAWQVVADEMPSVIGGILKGVDVRALSVEQAQQSVALIQQTVLQVNALIDALDLLPFENLKGLSFDLAASLLEAAGGFDALMTGAASYYDAFFSDQEKYEVLLKSTADEVSRLGYELPDTRDGFRGLVESLDAMDSSNHDAIATLLKLSSTADQVYAYQEKLADEAVMLAAGQQSLIESFNKNFQTEQELFSRLSKELASSVKDLGLELPATRDEFRDLVESFISADGAIDATGKSLLVLSDKSHVFYTELERQADAAIQAAEALAREEEKLARDRVTSAQKAANDLLGAQSRIESQFASVMSSVTGSFDSLRERITLDVLKTDEEKYGYYKSQYDMLSDELSMTTDASRIGQIVQEMNRAASSAYSLLDEDVRQGGKGQEYLDMIDAQRLDAVQRLNRLEEDAKKKEYEEMKQAFSEISLHLKQILDAAGGNFEGAAEAINQAAVNMEAAISNPRQRGVEVTM